jgi:hypothetical protein
MKLSKFDRLFNWSIALIVTLLLSYAHDGNIPNYSIMLIVMYIFARGEIK